MRNRVSVVIASLLAASLTGCTTAEQSEQTSASDGNSIWPQITSEVAKDPVIEGKVKALLATMTLEQKVAQMIQPEIRDITPEDMRKYGFGSFLNGGGAFPNNDKHATPQDWIALAEAMYQASVDDSLDGSTIPTMWGTDAVHGHNNVIGATLFPHNIGLGAANNPELIEKIAKVTATEVMVTGIDWVFAPTVATVRDDRWGRTYEGYSEDPEIVKAYASAIVKGLQGHADNDFLGDDRVISTVKHFIGDGGTVNGDDQGNNVSSEQALFSIHGQGYVGGLSAGAQSVMASFNSWQGEKIHGNRYLLTDVLKNTMGFDGFVVGDWNGHGQVAGCSNASCPQAINAGLDVFMAPTETWKPLYENTIAQVKRGEIPMSRIDDAVTRILRVKFRAGLFDKPSPAKRKLSGKVDLIGHVNHRAVAKQAVRESLVLLKNKGNILPLSPKQHVLVAGDAANNIGKQSGGWTITWQGTNNQNTDFPGGTSIYDGIAAQVNAAGGQVTLSEAGEFQQKPDVAIVVFGEEPYAEGQGDVADLAYQGDTKADLALLKRLQAQGIPVVSVFISGRPLWVNAELNASDAFVAAWLPGSEGSALADVLLRDATGQIQHDFKGKLSFSWPNSPLQQVNRFDTHTTPLLPYGFGLHYGDANQIMDNLPEVYTAANDDNAELALFNGKVDANWQLFLAADGKQQAVTSNSAQLAGISFRTIDRNVQEDAFKLVFDGRTRAGIEFKTTQTQTANSLLSVGSVNLVIEARRDSDISGAVWLTAGCSRDQMPCSKQIDISSRLSAGAMGQWQRIVIDGHCLMSDGAVVEQLNPLNLSTKQAIAISISAVKFASAADNAADLSCH